MIVSIAFNNKVSYAANKHKVSKGPKIQKDPPTLDSKSIITRSTSFFVPLNNAELPPKPQPRKSKIISKDAIKIKLPALHQNQPRSSPYSVSLETPEVSSPNTQDSGYPLIRSISNNYGTGADGARTTQTSSRFSTTDRRMDGFNTRSGPRLPDFEAISITSSESSGILNICGVIKI